MFAVTAAAATAAAAITGSTIAAAVFSFQDGNIHRHNGA